MIIDDRDDAHPGAATKAKEYGTEGDAGNDAIKPVTSVRPRRSRHDGNPVVCLTKIR